MPRLSSVFEALGNVDRQIPEETTFTSAEGITIDPDCLANITSRLSARDLAALASSCIAMRAAAACTYPGIKLRLFPHQRASLAFLVKCEAAIHQRGGALADEPGTGKTVTMLALVCKTAGMRTLPPTDAAQARLIAADEQWQNLALPYKREAVYAIFKATRAACPNGVALFTSNIAEAADQLPRYRELVPVIPDDFRALSRDASISSFASRSAFDEAARAVPRAASACGIRASNPQATIPCSLHCQPNARFHSLDLPIPQWPIGAPQPQRRATQLALMLRRSSLAKPSSSPSPSTPPSTLSGRITTCRHRRFARARRC